MKNDDPFEGPPSLDRLNDTTLADWAEARASISEERYLPDPREFSRAQQLLDEHMARVEREANKELESDPRKLQAYMEVAGRIMHAGNDSSELGFQDTVRNEAKRRQKAIAEILANTNDPESGLKAKIYKKLLETSDRESDNNRHQL